MTDADLVVIGAGIAGLTVAEAAARAGRRVIVLEASPDIGGMLRRARVGDVDIDLGAEAFATRTTGVVDLLRDAALDLSDVAPEPQRPHLASCDSEGTVTLAPLPRRAVLGIPADPEAPDVVRILGPDGAARAARETSLPRSEEPEPTLAELVTARCGPTLTERLVEPLCQSVFSRSAASSRLSELHPVLWRAYQREGSLLRAADAIAPAVPTGTAVRGIVGGMWRLAAALADATTRHGADIRLGTDAREIGPDARGVRVVTSRGEITAERVVIATGASGARALLRDTTRPDAPAVRVISALVASTALDDAPVGSGVIVAENVPTRAKALTHASAKWGWIGAELPPGTHLVRVSLRTPEPALTRAELAAEIGLLTGTTLAETDIIDTATAVWDDATTAGSLADIDHDRWRRRGVFVAGAAVAGTGLASVIPHARQVAAGLFTDTTEETAS